MSAVLSESEDIELENVLQKIFIECNASVSVPTSHSMVSIGEELPISKIIEYIQNQFPNGSIECLLEYWKSLAAVSENDRVNLQQFKEASKRWIVRIQSQDNNNNIQDKLYNTNYATNLSMKMDKNITEMELRLRVQKFEEKNMVLCEELIRAEELIAILKKQCQNLENRLDRQVEKCHHLEKENDEQRDKLNEITKQETTYVSALERSTEKHTHLLKQLEAVEIEVQAIPSLKDKLEKMNKEKRDCIKQITKLKEEFYEREDECDKLKATIAELEDTTNLMKNNYDYMIRDLREKNRQLADENMELQSLSIFNECISGEKSSTSSTPLRDESCMHSTPYKSEKVESQTSLYAELKASGFTANCNSNNSRVQELEEELNEYDSAVFEIIEQLKRIIENCELSAVMRDSNDIPPFDLQDMNTRIYNIEALKYQAALLLNLVTNKIAKRTTKDVATQLRADSDMINSLGQFGIISFFDMPAYTRLCPKPAIDVPSIISQFVNDDKDDPFLRIIRASSGIIQERNIIDCIIEELDRIIQNSVKLPVNKDRSPYEHSRYRSIHTLPSNLQPLEQSLLNAEDTRRTSNKFEGSRTDYQDISFAQGNNIMQENRDQKFTIPGTELHNVSDPDKLVYLEKNQMSEMARITDTLQIDLKVLPTSKETDTADFQTSEISSTGITLGPRRKISVYSRSFFVVPSQDHRDNQELTLEETKRSLSDPSMQIEENIDETLDDHIYDPNSVPGYSFLQAYRNTQNNSDSSGSSTPQKTLKNSLLDEEGLVEQPALTKICLAPTRLKLSQEDNNSLNEVVEIPHMTKIEDSTYRCTNFSETTILDSSLSPVINSEHEKNDNTLMHSSSIVDKYERMDDTMFESKSCSKREDSSQKYLSSCLILNNQADSVKRENSEDPHSQTSLQRVDGQPCFERSVDIQMSSHEDSSVGSDSDCELAESSNLYIDKKSTASANEANKNVSAISSDSPINSTSMTVPCKNLPQNNEKMYRDLLSTKKEKRQRLLMVRRSFSEGDNNERTECHCKQNAYLQIAPLIREQNELKAFPSLANFSVEEPGIANLSNVQMTIGEDLSELELQKKYTTFSLCLATDRVTLQKRMALALRQRNQSERNLSSEVQKMQQDIQELAPLCTDSESVEKVERVKHQLDMIAQCAHRVSCAAETLGAVHQECRVSRTVLLTDRYLQILHSRCEKLAANVAETKRILIENNIVIEESSGEPSDDLPRIRYRSGTPANNRMMMARRRASIATISRPIGSMQDVLKDTVRQRNSVSGRVTLRRPSLSYESPKWETEKLDRTDSSSSIGELRDIFEQAESRRDSREENSNVLRLNQFNNQDAVNSSSADSQIWTNANQEASFEPPVSQYANRDRTRCVRSSQVFQLRTTVMPWRMMLWGILIFFLGFYVNHTMSTITTCGRPLNWWSVEEILKKYVQMKKTASRPM